MTITQSLDTVRELSPVFDKTGIGENRIITSEELKKFSDACALISNELARKDSTFSVADIIEQIGADIITNQAIVGFHMSGESAKRMLQI